jgi:hypothetical protein
MDLILALAALAFASWVISLPFALLRGLGLTKTNTLVIACVTGVGLAICGFTKHDFVVGQMFPVRPSRIGLFVAFWVAAVASVVVVRTRRRSTLEPTAKIAIVAPTANQQRIETPAASHASRGSEQVAIVALPVVEHCPMPSDSAWKAVSCEHCRQSYAVLVRLEGEAPRVALGLSEEHGRQEEPDLRAQRVLAEEIQDCVVTVPCPNCGLYQKEMVRELKKDPPTNQFQLVGATVMVLFWIPLTWTMSHTAIMAVIVAAAGFGLLTYGYVVSFRYDPNIIDSDSRKAIAKSYAVSGEQLAMLRKESPEPTPKSPQA